MQIMIIVNDDDLIDRNIFIKYNSKKLHIINFKQTFFEDAIGTVLGFNWYTGA